MIAAELVRREVAVIVATGGTPAVLPAMAATSTIPIVFITGGDPIKFGFVRSLNRPGGNVTGVNIFIAEMEEKRLGLLCDLVPTAGVVGVLLRPMDVLFRARIVASMLCCFTRPCVTFRNRRKRLQRHFGCSDLEAGLRFSTAITLPRRSRSEISIPCNVAPMQRRPMVWFLVAVSE